MKKLWYVLVMVIIALSAVNCEKYNKETMKRNSPSVGTYVEKADVVALGAEPVEIACIDQYAGERSKTEGPVADAEGNVYFSDPYGRKVYKWSKDGTLSIFTEKFNGPNGLAIDRDGNLIACEAYNRRVALLEKDGKVIVLADSFNGKKFNEPNDLFIDEKGGIYFSDPYFHVHSEFLEQKSRGVFSTAFLCPKAGRIFRGLVLSSEYIKSAYHSVIPAKAGIQWHQQNLFGSESEFIPSRGT